MCPNHIKTAFVHEMTRKKYTIMFTVLFSEL